jgi:hypothetical protein
MSGTGRATGVEKIVKDPLSGLDRAALASLPLEGLS